MSVTYNIEEKTEYIISNIERALESLFNQRNAIPTTEEEICYLEIEGFETGRHTL